MNAPAAVARKLARRSMLVLLGTLAIGRAAAAPNAAGENAPPPNGPVVQLPPMIVAESSKAPKWLYANAGGVEYLSRCSEQVTRDFIAAQLRINQLLGVIVPDTFLVKMDAPSVTLLSPLENKKADDDTVMKEMVDTSKAPADATMDARRRELPSRIRLPAVEFIPNLGVNDRDLQGLFAMLDQKQFDGDRLVALPDYVRFRLEQRTPMLPPWLIEGIVGIYRRATFTVDPVTLRPTVWLSGEESRALARDPERPRALLPAVELFAPDGAAGRNERYASIWRGQVALFTRWALDPANNVRDAFWHFAQAASEEPVSEEMFEACFGFGYSDLRDRLSDYLPLAVKDSLRIDPGNLPKLPRFEVVSAAPDQVARLRGEWERLEINYVKGRHPDFLSRYVDQARLTLLRAYDQGDRDPRLLATLGLCEVDSGNEAAARPYLEKATEADVVRPRAYYELARLRFLELTRGQPPTKFFSAMEIAPIVAPLRRAAVQAPAFAEIYSLFAEAWIRCTEAPPEADFKTLADSARLFRWRPALSFRIALLEARHGKRAQAAALLTDAMSYVTDEPTRARFAELRSTVTGEHP
jgi:hypothetical protein